MYPSSHHPTCPPPTGLTRYGSAPGSLLNSIADSVISEFPTGQMSRFFTGDSPCLTSESSCTHPAAAASPPQYRSLQRSYGIGDEIIGSGGGVDGGGGSHLIRHSSSPAGFFSNLMGDEGFPITRGIGHYSQPAKNGSHAMVNRRLKSQLSFSRPDTLSQISEISIPDMGESISGNGPDESAGNVGQSYISSNIPIGSWNETNSILFSGPPSKRTKDINGDMTTSLSSIDSQFTMTSQEMANVEKILQIQQDSVPFKIRAKRGCATHPRSIAERERRIRISEKLRKLQDLVPNMDKQTSTSDMLDLAVQHINELQSQVQILSQERASCKCISKQEIS